MAKDKLLYEYAIIRVVPRVERSEFINAGLILFCKKKDVLLCTTFLHKEKLLCLDSQADFTSISSYLEAFKAVALGHAPGNSIAQLDKPSRFRWLTAARSTVIQCSPVHPGLAAGIEIAFQELFEQMVK